MSSPRDMVACLLIVASAVKQHSVTVYLNVVLRLDVRVKQSEVSSNLN